MDPSDRTRHVTGITSIPFHFIFVGSLAHWVWDLPQTYPQLPIMVR
jgi:hypothetical protein